MLKKLIAVLALASAAFVGLSIPTLLSAPAGAEQMALFTCTPLGLGSQGYVYACEAYNGEKWLYIAK